MGRRRRDLLLGWKAVLWWADDVKKPSEGLWPRHRVRGVAEPIGQLQLYE